MATRKTIDDPSAWSALRDSAEKASNPMELVEAFETAEFETATTKIAGKPFEVRRVVLTGPWEPVK
jgi:hypothetical protein